MIDIAQFAIGLCYCYRMSTLTSASTFAAVVASYDNNASYFEDASVSKAKAFVTACRFLIIKLKEEVQAAQERVRQGINVQIVKAEMDAAQEYVSANLPVNQGGSGVRRLGFGGFSR